MKSFFQALIDHTIFAGKIVLGIFVTVWLVRLLESAAWQNTAAQASLRLPFVNNIKTAVIVVGGLFVVTWSLRFLDRTFFKEQLKGSYSLQSRAPLNLSRLVTANFFHGYDGHLYGNTGRLLLFAGTAVLITPDFQSFFLVTAVIILIQGLGVWIYGPPGSHHIGASGILLAYYSFNIVYGLVNPSWRNWIAMPLLIFFGRKTWRVLRYPGPNTSVVMHLWGFFSGIIAALLLAELGFN